MTITCAVTACGSENVTQDPPTEAEAGSAPERSTWIEPLPNAPAPLITPTYDGSGQAVEPTVLYFADAWRGHHYWMAVSPYPHGDATHENPSILVSEDGLSWDVPSGLTNPLVLPARGTLSDATVVHDDASDELWVYYLDDVRHHGVDVQSMHRITSADGIHWSRPELLFSGDNYPIQSPSVIKVGETFMMWTVDSGRAGCRTSATTVNLRTSRDGVRWTAPSPVSIAQPGYVIWHLNMIPVPETGHVLALLAAYREGKTCSTSRLFLADSDGLRWQTFDEALLSPGRDWDTKEIYRSSLLYDPSTTRLRVWYSARQRLTNHWHVGYTEGLRPLP